MHAFTKKFNIQEKNVKKQGIISLLFVISAFVQPYAKNKGTFK